MYIPRGLIWEDRSSLEDFEIDRQGTLDYAFYEALQMVGKMDEKWPESLEEEHVYMFNDAYYISLLILRERMRMTSMSSFQNGHKALCGWSGWSEIYRESKINQ